MNRFNQAITAIRQMVLKSPSCELPAITFTFVSDHERDVFKHALLEDAEPCASGGIYRELIYNRANEFKFYGMQINLALIERPKHHISDFPHLMPKD